MRHERQRHLPRQPARRRDAGWNGVDLVDYGRAWTGVTVSLTTGTGGGGDGDRYSGVEGILGSSGANQLPLVVNGIKFTDGIALSDAETRAA